MGVLKRITFCILSRCTQWERKGEVGRACSILPTGTSQDPGPGWNVVPQDCTAPSHHSGLREPLSGLAWLKVPRPTLAPHSQSHSVSEVAPVHLFFQVSATFPPSGRERLVDVGSVCLACHCVCRTQGSRWEEFVTGGLADRKARSSCQGLKGQAVGEEKAMEKLPISPEETKI